MVIERGATPTIVPPARTCTLSHGSTGRPSGRHIAAYSRMDTSGYRRLPFGRTGAIRLGNPNAAALSSIAASMRASIPRPGGRAGR